MRDGTSGATGALQCRDPMYVQLGAVAEVAARLQPDCVHLPWSSCAGCARGTLGMGESCLRRTVVAETVLAPVAASDTNLRYRFTD